MAAAVCGWPERGYDVDPQWLETGKWRHVPSDQIEDKIANLLVAVSLGCHARIAALAAALAACGTSDVNPDCCGVCSKHFHECDQDKATHQEYPVSGRWDEAQMFPACAGGRARVLLRSTEWKGKSRT